MSSNVSHWMMQSVTGVLIIPFALYSCVEILSSFLYYDDRRYEFSFSLPVSVFMILVLYHGAIGLRVVIEDYVSCVNLSLFLVYFTYIISAATAMILILFTVGFSFSNVQ